MNLEPARIQEQPQAHGHRRAKDKGHEGCGSLLPLGRRIGGGISGNGGREGEGLGTEARDMRVEEERVEVVADEGGRGGVAEGEMGEEELGVEGPTPS